MARKPRPSPPTDLNAAAARLVAAYRDGGRPAAQHTLDAMMQDRTWLQIEQTVMLGRFRAAILAQGIVPPRNAA